MLLFREKGYLVLILGQQFHDELWWNNNAEFKGAPTKCSNKLQYFEKEDSVCMNHGSPLELRDPMLPSAQLTVQIITGLLHFYMKMEARSC